jgi:hypothetical protein
VTREKSEVVRTVERLEQRFDSLLSEPKLDNFDGTVSVRVSDKTGKELPRDQSRTDQLFFRAGAGQRCRLDISFAAGQPRGENGGVLYQELRIRRGNAASQVTFDIFLDSRAVKLEEYRSSVTFDPSGHSPPLTFNFVAPVEQGEHELFVEISQKNRLLQSMLIKLRVGSDLK